jgi:hypothetical protein
MIVMCVLFCYFNAFPEYAKEKMITLSNDHYLINIFSHYSTTLSLFTNWRTMKIIAYYYKILYCSKQGIAEISLCKK